MLSHKIMFWVVMVLLCDPGVRAFLHSHLCKSYADPVVRDHSVARGTLLCHDRTCHVDPDVFRQRHIDHRAEAQSTPRSLQSLLHTFGIPPASTTRVNATTPISLAGS